MVTQLRAPIVMGSLAIAVAIAFSLALITTASAAKPVEVVKWSNGFPSGPHYKLNIHGKKADFTVLEEDPYTVPIETLKDIPIWGTVFEGQPYPIAATGEST